MSWAMLTFSHISKLRQCLWIRCATYYEIQHFALCLITLQSPLPLLPFVLWFLSSRGSSSSSSSSISTACSIFFVCPFTQCSFTSHLQYEVHDTPSDKQLRWLGYSWYKFGGLLTSTPRVQLCITGINRRSSKYVYVCQVAAPLCFATTC